MRNNENRNAASDFLIYADENGGESINVLVSDETVWLTQKQIAELFDTTKQNVSLHLKNIFSEQELDQDSVVKDFLTTAADGKSYSTQCYNLDAIIAVGYRINSKKATSFRQWATKVLRSLILKGFVLDKERLKNGRIFDKNYFDELLEEIREIRASERLFYQKVTDLYATAFDYNKNSPLTKDFFAKVQNKLHFSIHHHTASELIKERADAEKDHMGLTTWKNAPDGKIYSYDVVIAKNYLSQKELTALNRLVSAYLDLAEDLASQGIPMSMEAWATQLDDFLKLSRREILEGKGKVSAEEAREHALKEYKKFRIKQDALFKSDYDLISEKALKALKRREEKKK